MSVRILNIAEAADFVTNTKAPKVEVTGGAALPVFNRDMDMAGIPEHLLPWAQRWQPVLRDPNAVVTNSLLDKREWALLDRAIFEAVKLRQNGLADLRARGLVATTTIATMLSQWRMATERIRPYVSMDGVNRATADRTDRKTFGVPVPVFRTDYFFSRRELLASRTLGSSIDTFEAGEAAAAVAEEQERMLFNGEASVVVEGNTIYGYTTHTARDTATAAAYGGGDFGTITNIVPTFLGMMAALSAKRYNGPYNCYVAPTQYNQMLAFYTDGSGQTALQRVLMLPQISAVKPSDFLVDATTLMVQMTPNVVDWLEAMGIENREWTSGDQEALNFAVLAAGVPRLKSDASGYLGVAHATSC